MPTTEMRFSDLTTASILNDDDILALSKVDQTSASGYMSYKATMIAIGLYITKLATYTSDLQTTDKTIIGAINELKQLIALIPQFDIQVVEELPTEDISETTIYMVPSENPETENAYDEFIYVDDEWEQVGSTAVDLSAYYNKLEVDGLLDLKESKADMEEDVAEILEDLSDDVTVTGNPVIFETINGGMAKSCEVTTLPIQDLHGQSAPYPAGGGKNRLNKDDSSVSANTTWLNENCVLPAGTYTFSFKSSTTSGQCTFNVFDSNGDRIYQAPNSIQLASTVTHTFTISAEGARVSSYINTASNISEIMIEVGNQKTDFAPYSNICPISGRDSVDVLNLPDSAYQPFFDGVKDGTYGFADLSTLNWVYATSAKRWEAQKTDMKSYPSRNADVLFANYKTDTTATAGDNGKGFISGTVIYIASTNSTVSPTGMCIYPLATATTPSYTPEQYQALVTAFGGQTVTIQLGQTVYYGILDVVNGVLKILGAIVDFGSLTWSMTSTSGCFRTHGLDSLAEIGTTGQADAISTIYKNNPTARDVESLPDSSFCVGGSQSSYKLFLKDTRYTSASDFESAISGQKICYKLATTQEITLTAEQIELLKGINVLSTDANELKLVASKLANIPDLLTYIQSLEARIKALEEA